MSHVGCRLCSRGCSRVPRAVLQSRVPAEPQGLCAGQGLCRLPGSALSLPGELPRALRGDVWGEGAPRQGRAGAFCCHSCCLGQGTYSLRFSKAKPGDFTTEIGQCLSASVWAFLSHWFLFLLLCLSRNRYKCCDFREVEMA